MHARSYGSSGSLGSGISLCDSGFSTHGVVEDLGSVMLQCTEKQFPRHGWGLAADGSGD